MERNCDEVISEMLIQLDHIERRMEKADKRMELSIKRLVKTENRMEVFDKKLEQSMREQKENFKVQRKINEHFLNQLSQQSRFLGKIIQKNNLKT